MPEGGAGAPMSMGRVLLHLTPRDFGPRRCYGARVRRIPLLVGPMLVGACTGRPVVYQEGTATDPQQAECLEECDEGEVCFEGTCVGTGLIRVSLAWEVVTDLDLHVVTPEGIEIFYGNPSAAGLTLDVDDCVGGVCADNDGVHVENVFFSADAVRGTYKVFVVNFDGLRESYYRVEVVTLDGVTILEWQDQLPAVEYATSMTRTFEW